MSTVFITNQNPAHNYNTASQFGSLVYLTTGNYPVFMIDRLIIEMTDRMVESDAGDFLLFSGSSTIAALAASLWLQKHPVLNLLLFDRSEGQYVYRAVAKTFLRGQIERAAEDRTGGLVRRNSP